MHLLPMEKLASTLFEQRWRVFLDDPLSDPSFRFPGIYLLAYSKRNLKQTKIREEDVLYVGMSNAQGGVRSRLLQFRTGVERYGTHSGAMRFFREYQNSVPHSQLKRPDSFFYAALSIQCASEKGSLTAADLRSLGHVACLEYYAIARIREKTGRPPPLNKFGKRPINASSERQHNTTQVTPPSSAFRGRGVR